MEKIEYTDYIVNLKMTLKHRIMSKWEFEGQWFYHSMMYLYTMTGTWLFSLIQLIHKHRNTINTKYGPSKRSKVTSEKFKYINYTRLHDKCTIIIMINDLSTTCFIFSHECHKYFCH